MTHLNVIPCSVVGASLLAAVLCAASARASTDPGVAAMAATRALPAVIAPNKNAEAKGLLFLASSLSERSDFAAAEIAYKQILDSNDYKMPDKKDALLGLARMYHRAGSYTKAAALNEKFLKEFPDEPRVPDVLLEQGRVLRSMGVYRMAISRFYSVIDSTLKVQSDNFDHYQLLAKTAQFEIAETHFVSGDYAEAGKFFARLRLLDLAPADRARAHFMSAYALKLAGDLEGAVTTLRSFLDQWPKDENVPEARYLLATTLLELKRNDESLATTMALLRGQEANSAANPKLWAYWQRRTGNQLANEFFQHGDPENALAIYKGLAAISPDVAWRLPVTYQIGLCYERLRRTDLAQATYQSIIDLASQPPDAKSAAASPVVQDEINELAHMAKWRKEHLEWSDRTDGQLMAFFSTGSLPTSSPVKSSSANDTSGSPPKAPSAVQ